MSKRWHCKEAIIQNVDQNITLIIKLVSIVSLFQPSPTPPEKRVRKENTG